MVAGVNAVVADVNAVVAGNVDGSSSVHAVSSKSRTRIVQRSGGSRARRAQQGARARKERE